MRDPKRIRRILAKLEAVWNKAPDMRLGQLITNIGITWHLEDERDPKWVGPKEVTAEEKIEAFDRLLTGEIKKK